MPVINAHPHYIFLYYYNICLVFSHAQIKLSKFLVEEIEFHQL